MTKNGNRSPSADFDTQYQPDPSSSPHMSDYGMAQDAFEKSGTRRETTSDLRQKTKMLRAGRPSSYEVGYAKPPIWSRFLPGQSGNPYGRPLGARNKSTGYREALSLRQLVLEQSNREVPVQEAGKTKKISIKDAVIHSTFANAVKGDARAQKLTLAMIEAAEMLEQKERLALYEAAVDYKLAWEKRVADHKAAGGDEFGYKLDRPLPDPDHIHVDRVTGAVEIRGPMSVDDLEKYNLYHEEKTKTLAKIRALFVAINVSKDEGECKKLKKDLRKANTYLGKLNFLIGDWQPS